MRISRKLLLGEVGGTVHIYWQCHNRSFLLEKTSAKRLYLRALSRALKNRKILGKVKIFSFCIMDNHIHLILKYDDSYKILSQFLQIAHTIFGVNYNRIEKRSGAVASHRPRTPLIQNEAHSMRTHFYVEANPIRAKKFRFQDLRKFIFSSFRFFAYGEKDELTELLEVPQWYKNLGETDEQRRKNYLKLFIEYLKEFGEGVIKLYFKNYIGEQMWCSNQMTILQNARHLSRKSFSSA